METFLLKLFYFIKTLYCSSKQHGWVTPHSYEISLNGGQIEEIDYSTVFGVTIFFFTYTVKT